MLKMFKIFNKDTSIETLLDKLLSIHELDRFGGYIATQMTLLRNTVPILIVDDADAEVIRGALEKFDFKNVDIATERPSDEHIGKYPIIITDVCGVGQNLNSNGLLFAEHIKECFPLKQVLVISGQIRPNKKNEAVIRKIDGFFKKGSSYDELARLIDPCLRRVSDPALIWRQIRDELLMVQGAEKKDTEIGKIALWEDQYVRQFLKVGRVEHENTIKNDWLSEMMRITTLATQVVDLLRGIISCS